MTCSFVLTATVSLPDDAWPLAILAAAMVAAVLTVATRGRTRQAKPPRGDELG